jgi:hypothetical protein
MWRRQLRFSHTLLQQNGSDNGQRTLQTQQIATMAVNCRWCVFLCSGRQLWCLGTPEITVKRGHFKQQTFTASTPISNPGNNNVVFESGAGIWNRVTVELRRKLRKKQPLTFIALFNDALISNSECQKSPQAQSTQRVINRLQTVTSHCQIGVRRVRETAVNEPSCYSHYNSFKTNYAHKLIECRNFTITYWV